MKILAIATCHNRKYKTMSALETLYTQSSLRDVELDIILVNDGCTDGTVEAVAEKFPEVHIIHGDGNLYWAGGMRAAWDYALSKHMKFDQLLVFNDDVKLNEYALKTLIEDHDLLARKGTQEIVITGNFMNGAKNRVTYGGWIRSSRWHPLRMSLQSPDLKTGKPTVVVTLNMNLALISRKAIDKYGFLADYFIHRGADFEYGLRVTKAGGVVASSSKVVGICERNSAIGTSSEPLLGRRTRLERLLSPKEEPLLQRFHFYRYHGGTIWPLLWLAPYLKVCFGRQR
jgi:GT2 family glycosyltransferase